MSVAKFHRNTECSIFYGKYSVKKSEYSVFFMEIIVDVILQAILQEKLRKYVYVNIYFLREPRHGETSTSLHVCGWCCKCSSSVDGNTFVLQITASVSYWYCNHSKLK